MVFLFIHFFGVLSIGYRWPSILFFLLAFFFFGPTVIVFFVSDIESYMISFVTFAFPR